MSQSLVNGAHSLSDETLDNTSKNVHVTLTGHNESRNGVCLVPLVSGQFRELQLPIHKCHHLGDTELRFDIHPLVSASRLPSVTEKSGVQAPVGVGSLGWVKDVYPIDDPQYAPHFRPAFQDIASMLTS